MSEKDTILCYYLEYHTYINIFLVKYIFKP